MHPYLHHTTSRTPNFPHKQMKPLTSTNVLYVASILITNKGHWLESSCGFQLVKGSIPFHPVACLCTRMIRAIFKKILFHLYSAIAAVIRLHLIGMIRNAETAYGHLDIASMYPNAEKHFITSQKEWVCCKN